MTEKGLIERVSRGIYILPNTLEDEFYSIGVRCKRTICDLVRSKSRMDVQIFTDALKRYSKRKDKDLNKLMKYAKIFKIDGKIREYMEVLI